MAADVLAGQGFRAGGVGIIRCLDRRLSPHLGEESVMVKVLRSFVRGLLESYALGFVEDLLRQGYSRAGAEQHVCLIAHLDRWLSAEDIDGGELSRPVIERYLAERRSTSSTTARIWTKAVPSACRSPWSNRTGGPAWIRRCEPVGRLGHRPRSSGAQCRPLHGRAGTRPDRPRPGRPARPVIDCRPDQHSDCVAARVSSRANASALGLSGSAW